MEVYNPAGWPSAKSPAFLMFEERKTLAVLGVRLIDVHWLHKIGKPLL